MRVAVVADPLTVYGGAERVIEEILGIFPTADFFALIDVLPADARGFLRGRAVRTSFLQRLPGKERLFRKLFALWPLAIEQFDLSGYDLVISSHFSVAHGVITGPGQVHVAYTYSPMRYAWDLQHQYLQEAGLARGVMTLLARPMLHRARLWDVAASMRVGHFAAISSFIAQRIQRYYRRDAVVIHPPVATALFPVRDRKEEFYLFLGRLVPYKRVDLLVKAFQQLPDRQLLVAGDGPQRAALELIAPPNVHFLGHVSHTEAVRLLGEARAFLFPAIEDFGIAPLEAQASGTPVIALGQGGALDTIRGLDHPTAPTGVLFDEQTPEAVVAAVERFERVRASIRPLDCRANAERFRPEIFRARFTSFVEGALAGDASSPLAAPLHPALPGQRGAEPAFDTAAAGDA